ncbi:hypothetical protein GPA22_21760 [Aromatoleum toluvorans]|uniref:DUF11 domain-containing protein n=1 Tax=Aromatoleum toluvorans TaxID=92002 RepID=A0ABX1Q3Q2_9RHOO|nr:hypothetical protein [Aromatoleum toluvorans]NMG46349.1 hypothetical protein [Aromatoleum toluvorans]
MRMVTRWLRSCVRFISVTALATGGLLLGAPPASAQSCMQDVWMAHGNTQGLTCTANDVTLSAATNLCVVVSPPGGPRDLNNDGCQDPNQQGQFTCVSGQSFTFTADFTMPLTAQARYDLGLYIATDGGGSDGALTGQCTPNVVTAANSATFHNKDAGSDICGDIDDTHNPQVIHQSITTVCTDTNGDGKVNLPWCTSWRQPGSNEVCDSGTFTTAGGFDAYPGSPSKCNCGNLNIDVFLETASITVDKTASPTTVLETGGSVTYTVSVTNNAQLSNVTLDTLTDNLYGDITTTGHNGITATTCAAETTIPAESNDQPPPNSANPYICTFTVAMGGGNKDAVVTDIVTVCGTDQFGHSNLCDDDPASVTYIDVATDPALLKTAHAVQAVQVDVQYSVTATNNSAVDTLTLSSLSDDKFGNLSATSSSILSTDCLQLRGGASPVTQLPVTIPPGGSYTCTFVGRITSVINGQHVNTASATASDEDGVTYPRASPPRPANAPDFTDTATVNISVTIP